MLSDEALAVMQIYDWPGNVTQLRNVIDWLSIMVDRDRMQSSCLMICRRKLPAIQQRASSGLKPW